MTTYGLTDAGFIPKTLSILREELNAALRDAFGASIKLHDKSALGQVVGILSERLAHLWELAEIAFTSQDPDKATRAALEALSLLTGTFRRPATRSVVSLVLTGTPTTPVPQESRVATESTAREFETVLDAVIAALTAWATGTVYAIGDRRTANGHVYQVITAGTSDVAGSGPNAPGEADITDGTVHWTHVGEGTGAVDVTAICTITGPIVALARDVNVRLDNIVGWDGVINLVDASVGKEIATDAELRQTREDELAAGGSTPVNALRAELLRVPKVVAVTVFHNFEDVTNADGVPPHSVEALVRGPASPDAAFDQSIFDALLAGVAGGIRTHGSGGGLVSGFATDDQGTQHVMKFTRPTEVPIYVTVTLTKDPNKYPVDGDAQVELAIVEYGDAQDTGTNAVAAAINARVFDIDGVLDATVHISTAPGPTLPTTIAISLRELATYDTGRITIVSSNGVP